MTATAQEPALETGVVLRGDCLKLMEKLPDASVDMICADLPYAQTRNSWDKRIPMAPLWEQYRRILAPRGVIALTASGVFGAEMVLAGGKLYRYSLVWKKNKPRGFLNSKRQPLRVHEDVHVFYRRQPKFTPIKTTGHAPVHAYTKHTSDGSNYGTTKRGISGGGSTERYPTSVLEIPVVNNDDEIKTHPTQKPTALGSWLIRAYTSPNDVVLDNACGTGAFLVAAAQTGRRWIGMELDRKFHRLAVERLSVPDPV